MTNYNDDAETRSDSGNTPAPTGRKTRKPGGRPLRLIDPKEGLKALDAAMAVMNAGPLRWGEDGRFWAYDGGVYVPGEDVVHGRIVRILGNHYRPSHSNAIRDVTRALVDPIDCSPVPRYINFTDGLLDWQNPAGPVLLPHDPAVPTTVQLSVPWRPRAECGDFRRFLADVIPADDTSRVWEILGYMLLSGNPLHRAFLLSGGGRNGKGTFIRTVIRLLGKKNVSNTPLHDLSSNRFATAQLYGKVANICGDIDATYIENTGRIKEITGEDEVQAEHKFGQPFRFTAWCSMLFSANEIPGSADSSQGWADRWEVIPFPNYIGDRVDPTLEERLHAPDQLAGVAAAAVHALRVLMDRRGFRVTEASAAAKDEFARKSNPLITFIDERCALKADAWVKRDNLFQAYSAWAADNTPRPMMKPRFYEKLRQLSDRGIRPAKRNGVDGFAGISLDAIP